MSFTIKIKKEVEIRFCKITVQPDGTALVSAFADTREYITQWELNSLDNARHHCEDVQLGGVVHWEKQGNTWTSDSVLCANGGTRLTPPECELARKALARTSKGKARV
jgi:hypothetical protein